MTPIETDTSSGSDSDSDSDGPGLEPDFSALKQHASKELSKDLTTHRKLTRGRYHEIYILSTSEGWTCIARLSRHLEDSAKFRSEVATMRYVRSKTTIPVPEVYMFDDSEDNDVGVQYVVMERMAGKHLFKIWDRLSLEHQRAALTEIASVVARLAGLQFTKIGSLREDGTIGPLLHRTGIEVEGVDDWITVSSGPFANTFDYLFSFVKAVSFPPGTPQEETSSLTHEVQRLLKSYFSKHSGTRYLDPPFCLIHEDFDGQNMLFTDPDETGGQPPKLTAIIDWEYAHTGPLYFLYEYPNFIQDEDHSQELYARNAILRPHFVRALRAQFSSGSEEYESAKQCLPAGKCSILNRFKTLFMDSPWEWDTMKRLWENYIMDEIGGTGTAYGGRPDWVPDVDEP